MALVVALSGNADRHAQRPQPAAVKHFGGPSIDYAGRALQVRAQELAREAEFLTALHDGEVKAYLDAAYAARQAPAPGGDASWLGSAPAKRVPAPAAVGSIPTPSAALPPPAPKPAPTAPASGKLACIAQKESGGNPHASNGTHFGLYQFSLQTWASVGGRGDPRSASPAEQTARAQALAARSGFGPWTTAGQC